MQKVRNLCKVISTSIYSRSQISYLGDTFSWDIGDNQEGCSQSCRLTATTLCTLPSFQNGNYVPKADCHLEGAIGMKESYPPPLQNSQQWQRKQNDRTHPDIGLQVMELWRFVHQNVCNWEGLKACRRKDQESRKRRRHGEGMRTCSTVLLVGVDPPQLLLTSTSQNDATVVYSLGSVIVGRPCPKASFTSDSLYESQLDSLHWSHQVGKALHSALVQSSKKQIVRTLKVVPSQKD